MTKPAQADIDTVLHARFPLLHLMGAVDSLESFYAANNMAAGPGKNKPGDHVASLRAALKFGITEQRVRKLLPKQEAKQSTAHPFQGLAHRIK